MEINYGEVIHRINCLASDMDVLYHQAAQKMRMSDSVMILLYMVHVGNGKCPLRDIQKETGIRKQTLNSALRKLEKDEIIYLEQTDGRAKTVCFTEKGASYAKLTVGRLIEAECSTFRDWTAEEIEQYLSLLERYNRGFRAQIEKMQEIK